MRQAHWRRGTALRSLRRFPEATLAFLEAWRLTDGGSPCLALDSVGLLKTQECAACAFACSYLAPWQRACGDVLLRSASCWDLPVLLNRQEGAQDCFVDHLQGLTNLQVRACVCPAPGGDAGHRKPAVALWAAVQHLTRHERTC